MLRLFTPGTLKFKIVALAVLTGVLAALLTANLVLTQTRADFERAMLQSERTARSRTAALLGSKVETLLGTVQTIARAAPSTVWNDETALTAYLRGNGAATVLFDSVLGVQPDGWVLAYVTRVPRSINQVTLASREYFRQALRSDQPVVSEPLKSLASGIPIVVIAAGARDANGRTLGVVAGSIELRSSPLFAELNDDDGIADSRYFVMDRHGRIVVHADPARTLADAATEPGFGAIYRRWHESGSPIDLEGRAEIAGDWVVSQAGIPNSDWTLVQLTPVSTVFQPITDAQRTARWTATGVGALVALLAALAALALTRPISRLRQQAQSLLDDDTATTEAWPPMRGELGSLARAFGRVVEQRQRRQAQTQALLGQLEAVLQHVETGITMARDDRFELVSRRLCEILRCTAQDMVGQSTSLLFRTEEDRNAFRARSHPALAATGLFEDEVELVRRDGEPFWSRMRGRAVEPGDRSKGTIWAIEDITQERDRREKLVWSSSHDPLTGLANRAAFDAQLASATADAARDPSCALFLDLDRFKQVNDTAGHAAGDALLRDIASQLVSHVRRSDLVARFGGDEFAVLLTHCELDQARVIAENLRRAVIDYRLLWEGQSFGVGASIGVVHMDGGHENPEAVLKDADAACYAAKQRGRNAVVVHGE